MKAFHTLTITAFATDPVEKDVLFDEFLAHAGLDLEKNTKNTFVQEDAGAMEGYSGDMTIFTITVMKNIENVLKYLLADQKETWIDTLDDDNFIYMRFSKEFFSQGKFVPTNSGNCVHVKAKIAAYPAKKEVALATYQRFLDESN
jgi:RNA binding exosome subunit